MNQQMDETLNTLLEETKESRDRQSVEATAYLIKAINKYKINFS